MRMPEERDSTQCAIFEIEDGDKVDAEKSHDLHYIPLSDFDIPHGNDRNRGFMEGFTAGGLLLLYPRATIGIPLYICSLITREYTELCYPADCIPRHSLEFGFGVSKISGQYKVVCINERTKSHYVYTLGIGSWRRVEAGAASGFEFRDKSIECNDNLHWIVFDLNDSKWICGFDVETECLESSLFLRWDMEMGICLF